MSISIVIPTIGSPSREIVKDAIESALITSPDIWSQIIIVDNSKSSEFNIFLKNITKEEPRVEIHQVNHPMTMAECWNYGLNLVKNKWHLYLHDDDILIPGNWIGLDLNSNIGLISLDYEVFGFQNRLDRRLDTGLHSIILNTPKFVSTLINTEALNSIGGWKDEFGYFLDLVAFCQLSERFGHIHLASTGGKYRVHQESASHIDKRKSGYGKYLTSTLSALKTLTNDSKLKKVITYQCYSFAYPEKNFLKRLIKRVAFFGGFTNLEVEK